MAIAQLSRWKVAAENTGQMTGLAKRVKGILVGHGAETMLLGRVYAGPFAGQWMDSIRCDGWATYGSMMEAASNDPEYQTAMAAATKLGELLDRSIIVGVDI